MLPPGKTRRRAQLRDALRLLAPLLPLSEFEPVFERALKLNRSGLTPAVSVWLALVSHVRHRFTDYDQLLADGYDRDAARFFVANEAEAVLRGYGCSRRIDTDGEEPEPGK
jgi:hypothetical protein